jgi:hypothetical protein
VIGITARRDKARDPSSALNLDTSITDAIVSHRLWRMRFASALEDGLQALRPEIIEAEAQCALGKWLQATEIPRQVRESKQFNDVVELHRDFHRVAGLVLAFAKKGRHQQFSDALKPDGTFSQASSALVDALMALKRHSSSRDG